MSELEPSPEYAGNYSWFSLCSLHNQGQIEQRKPWHQKVYLQEAQDAWKQIKRLIDTGRTAIQFGADLDTEKVKVYVTLLQPSEGQTLERQRILFPNLHQQDLEGLEEGELNPSPVPSEGDLDILSGDWLKKVSWSQETNKTEDKEEKSDADNEDDEEEQENSQYFDAKQISDTPPHASSAKKAPKVKKKVKRAKKPYFIRRFALLECVAAFSHLLFQSGAAKEKSREKDCKN